MHQPSLKQGFGSQWRGRGLWAGWAVPASLDQLFLLDQTKPKQQHQSINQSASQPASQPLRFAKAVIHQLIAHEGAL